MFGILRDFRRLLDRLDAGNALHREALQGLAGSIRDLASAQREAGPAAARLEALELNRAQFEAEMQGLLLKADGKLQAANNAEARERTMKRSYEKDADPFAEGGQEGSPDGGLLPIDVAAGETEGMPPVRVALETNTKAHAVRAKWGT